MINHWNILQSLREDYIKYVKLFVETDAFDNFKQDPSIKMIIENTSYESGLDCLEIIKRQYPKYTHPKHLHNIAPFEKFGNPDFFQYLYPSLKLSPTTLRYIMHLAQIESYFGSLDDLVIGEIGAGYGGLCTIMHEYFHPKKYILFDMPEVMELQLKYINKFNSSINAVKWTDEKKPSNIDIIIAFCSWAELDKESKLDYLMFVIGTTKKGVIGINYDFEENLELLREYLPNKDIKIRVPEFIVTFE